MVELEVNVSNLDEEGVKKLIEYMKEKFKGIAEVDLKGELLIMNGEKLSKSKVKLYLKKFLHSQGIEGFKVLSGGGNLLLMHRMQE
ncbi:MAG: hypothetical protein ACTSR0_04460 [Candidatus Asgardarchaeia archaeon]